LLRMRRVDQGHARNLVGVPGGIHLRVQAAVRMAPQHVGALSVGVGEQGVQFGGDLFGVSGFGPLSLQPRPERS
jgi:hypothetical protein